VNGEQRKVGRAQVRRAVELGYPALGLLVVGGAVAAVLVLTSPSSPGAVDGRSGSVTLSDHEHHHVLHYTISGNAASTVVPGRSTGIDLSFDNPNGVDVVVSAGTIHVAIRSPRRACPAASNFQVVHTLTVLVSIPARTKKTLSELGVTPRDWPRIKMLTTPFTQDGCAGMTYSLRYWTGTLP
jgi:hypothetical protein